LDIPPIIDFDDIIFIYLRKLKLKQLSDKSPENPYHDAKIIMLLKLSGRQQTRLLTILIASVVFASFLPVLNNGFVWDDDLSLVSNFNYRGLSFSNLYWMFTTFHDANYHPLFWLTLGVDFVLWDMSPAGYHLTNLVLHVLNAVLFYFIIIQLLRYFETYNGRTFEIQISAAVGALFFAVHPLRVETVAWVSARGDLLCCFFYLLTIIAYVRMSEKQAAAAKRKWFLLALLFFVFSLLSRAWGMTLPLVLLILDLYPLGRFDPEDRSTSSRNKVLLEKIPFAIFALGAAILALWAKKGSMLELAQHGIIDRFFQAAYGLCFYIWKTVVPLRLGPFYLLDKTFNPLAMKYILCAFLVISITTGLIVMRHRWPWALTAGICYAVIVSPQLGLVQSGPQIVADRYTYIACLPVGVLVGGGVTRLWIAWHQEYVALAAGVASAILICISLLVLSFLSFSQSRIWYDDLTLLDYGVKLNPKDSDRYYYRGLLREKMGDLKSALEDYTSAIKFDPEHAKAYNNRGALREIQGNLAGALADLNNAIRLAPFSPEAYANRGVIRQAQNDLERAAQDFTKALEVADANWAYRMQIEKLLVNVQAKFKEKDSSAGLP